MANATILQDFQLDKSPVTGVRTGPNGGFHRQKKYRPNQRFRRANNTAERCGPGGN
jgi:hypothetical protein